MLRGTVNSTELLIGDLLIHDGTSAVGRELGEATPWWLQWAKFPERNWQKQGLGSAMLEFAVSMGRERGLEKIRGNVVEDCEGRLKRFYIRNGFTIMPPDDPEFPYAIYAILMTL